MKKHYSSTATIAITSRLLTTIIMGWIFARLILTIFKYRGYFKLNVTVIISPTHPYCTIIASENYNCNTWHYTLLQYWHKHMQKHTPFEAAKVRAAILGNAAGLESDLASCPSKRDKAQLGSPQDRQPTSMWVPWRGKEKLKDLNLASTGLVN